MKNVNAITMSFGEFRDYIVMVSNGEASVESECGEWFYVSTEQYDADNIEKDLSDYLHVNIKYILIDLTTEDEDNVVLILEQIEYMFEKNINKYY